MIRLLKAFLQDLIGIWFIMMPHFVELNDTDKQYLTIFCIIVFGICLIFSTLNVADYVYDQKKGSLSGEKKE